MTALHLSRRKISTSFVLLPEMTSSSLSDLGRHIDTMMKGFLKGLRYLQQMFEDDEKEPEIKIGLPTDVKHVAHIGHDGLGPSVNSPSWMSEFHSASELSSARRNNKGAVNTLAGVAGVTQDHNASEKPKHRSRRKSLTSTLSPLGSPKAEKHNKRRSSNSSMDSPSRDPSSNLNRRKGCSNLGAESPMQDAAMPPKHSRQKKSSKGSSGDGSTKPSRSKCQNSLPDVLELES